MQLQYDNLTDVPVELVNDFEEFSENGKVVVIPKSLATAKKETLRFQGDLSSLKGKFDKYVDSHEKAKTELEEKAKAEKETAVAEQVAKLTEAGKLAEANELKLEQERDARASLVETNQTLNKQIEDQQASIVQKSNKSLSLEIASKYTTPDKVASLTRLLEIDSIGFNEGLSIFKDANGNTIGNDIGSILASLDSDPNYSHFKTFTGGKPGVGAKGGQQQASQSKEMYRDDFQKLPAQQQAKKMAEGIRITNRP